jgi:NADH-quinone oxidoreductase subunit N
MLRLVTPFLASPALVGKVTIVLTVVAILTLLVGNLAALPQKNFKRLLAYSSIAHAGFLVMALASSPPAGGSISMTPATVIAFYLGAYLLMTLLAFLVMTTLRTKIAGEELDSFRGLAKRSPFLAFAMLVAMASLAGIPLTAGFLGKVFVFKLAVEAQQWTLLVFGLIGAAAGFYYYLKIAASMYLSEPGKDSDVSAIAVSPLAKITMILLMIVILLAGFNPGVILGLFA